MRLIRRIVLAGFMGAGKSTVGRATAERLGWSFVDTDALVESLSGRSIPTLFAEGEPVFRDWERRALESLLARDHVVVAVGGGAVTDAESRALMSALGPVVRLDAPLATLWSRVAHDPGRPLAADFEGFAARHRARQPLYARYGLAVDTERLTPAQAAEAIVSQLADEAELDVALGDRSYPIHIGAGALSALPALLDGTPGPCLVVTDETVAGLYADGVLAGLERAGHRPRLVVVPTGEASKSLAQAEKLYDACVEAGLRRHHPVVALGGGVVGDLAGFVAATYQRGVPFVQAPTTLLAQIDSAVGGKVAVNHPGGKNMIGAFHQPRLVVADTAALLTLSDREYRAGLGELVKYGVIQDPALFALLETEIGAVRDRDLPLLNRLVARCCELKAQVVAADEREEAGGLRAILNFGHTVGHAIEAVAGYGTVLHGEAVAMGMVAEGRLAVKLGLWNEAELGRLKALLTGLGLETALPDLDAEALMAAMGRDKKNRDAAVTFVLPRALGDVVVQGVNAEQARAAL